MTLQTNLDCDEFETGLENQMNLVWKMSHFNSMYVQYTLNFYLVSIETTKTKYTISPQNNPNNIYGIERLICVGSTQIQFTFELP